MYIKLGDTNITYRTDSTEDYMILGEIVDSPFSYQSPTLVRNSQELDIWFSSSFPDRNYLVELLNLGNTLYLYKPVSTESIKLDENSEFFDYENYTLCNFLDGNVTSDIITSFLQIFKDDIENFKIKVLNESQSDYDYYIWSKDTKSLIKDNDSKLISLNDNLIIEYNELDNLNLIKNSDTFKIPYIGSDVNFWIWNGDTFITTAALSQNTEMSSSSLNNRDVLSITNKSCNIPYVYPEFKMDEKLGMYTSLPYGYINESIDDLDVDKLNNKLQTLVFELYNSNTNSNNLYKGYLVIIDPETKENCLIYNQDLVSIPTEVLDYCDRFYKISTNSLTVEDFITGAGNIYASIGYTIKKSEKGLLVYSPIPISVTNFYEYTDLKVMPRVKLSNLIVYDKIKDSINIEFWSKTIGGVYDTDPDGKIKILIEESESEKDYYKITISRYNFSEIFEGPLISTIEGEERIDYTISKQSKLVYCNLINNPTELRLGSFTMSGGKIERTDNSMWNNSLSIMFDYQVEPVYPDFFLIPDMFKYFIQLEDGVDHYPEYDTILEYATDFNCQFLIENSDSNLDYYRMEIDKDFDIKTIDMDNDTVYCFYTEAVEEGEKEDDIYYLNGKQLDETNLEDKNKILLASYGNNSIYNLTTDDENRLIYFFRPMRISGYKRPGYYLFLYSLLKNIYSISISDLQYKTITEYPYEIFDNEEISPEEQLLIDLKSNYLVNNNVNYYYKKYQNGDNYTTTIWMRFVLGKISRELQKNRWDYLGQKNLSGIQSKIERLLEKIKERFTIVNSIDLVEFETNLEENSLNLGIDVRVNDLVDNNLTLDISLDYYDSSTNLNK